MRTALLIVTLVHSLITLPACSAPPDPGEPLDDDVFQQEPIVGGKVDKQDPAVLAVDIDGEGLCSGTLIHPRAVLTARHCVSYTSDSFSCPADEPQTFGERPPASLSILSGKDVRTALVIAKGAAIVVPPEPVLCEQDIAVIVLDREVGGIAPLRVRRGPAPSAGDLIRAVGYGRRGDHLSAGKKYVREKIPLTWVGATEFLVGEATCNGDSGGPAIDPASGEVMGVVSAGGDTCEGDDAWGLYTRADAFAALIDGALASPAGVRQCGPGRRCPNGYHCSAQRVCALAK